MSGNAKRKQVKKSDQLARWQAAVAMAVEGLENRMMLTAAPVLYYHFNAPPDAGDVVTIPVGHLVHEAVPDALTEAVSAFLLTDAAPVSTDRT